MTTFGWDLCYTCNYRCPYCGIWQNASKTDVRISAAEWKKIWDRIHSLYGKCHIFVSGGEPSVYEDFFELIEALSEKHLPEICTNLSFDVDRLVPGIPAERLRIAPTFHPSFADFEDFFGKAKKVRAYLPDSQIYYVAYPGQIREMPERSRRLKEAGIKLIPLPLRGDGYMINSEEEKRIIEEVSPYKGSGKLDYQLQKISPKGKKCRAGKDYAVIRVNGKVDRCSQYKDRSVGNILDAEFRLFEEPADCGKEYCPIESQWIAEEGAS